MESGKQWEEGREQVKKSDEKDDDLDSKHPILKTGRWK